MARFYNTQPFKRVEPRLRVMVRYYWNRHPMAVVLRRLHLRSATLRVFSRRLSSRDERWTTIGFKAATETEKEDFVQGVFSRVASRYDLMNDAMSAGLHRLWKDSFVRALAPPPSSRVIDVAGGTGDVALRIAGYRGRGGREGEGEGVEVTVVDANADMLKHGKRKPGSDAISWVCGDALALPFPDNSFDAYTIAFGIRNVANFEQALSEAYRVLVPGGRFLCMELVPVDDPVLSKLYDIYSYQIIPVLGELIAGDRESYQYLVESIRQFPDPVSFEVLIRDVGFVHTLHWTLNMGIAAVHSAFKPFALQP